MTNRNLEVETLISLSFSFPLPLSFNLINVALLSPEVQRNTNGSWLVFRKGKSVDEF